MTFHFHNLPFWGVTAFFPDDHGRKIPRRRTRLIARWQRAADGRLECRWLPQRAKSLPD